MRVKIKFSQPVKLNREEAMSETIIDKTISNGHNSIESDILYIICSAINDMKYKGLKSFMVELIEEN
jgi:hypothetical protein